MELLLNAVQLYNVLVLLCNMLAHVMLSSNTNLLKLVLFVNSNDLVLLQLTHPLMFKHMVLNSLMPVHSFNKLALLVLLKTSHPQLLLLSDTLQQPMVKILASVLAGKAAMALVMVVVMLPVMVVVMAMVVVMVLVAEFHPGKVMQDIVVLDTVVDGNHQPQDGNHPDGTEVSILLVPLSVVLMLTKMDASIVLNSADSLPEVYK